MPHDHNHLGQPVGCSVPNWKSPVLQSGEPMEGRFCRLERLNAPLHAADLHAANALDAEGRMWTYLPRGPFGTLDLYRAWVEDMSQWTDPLLYTIIDQATGRAVGVAGY